MAPLFNLDFDGVVVDSLDRIFHFVAEAQKHIGEGRPPLIEDFRVIPNLTMPDMGRRLGISEQSLDRFVKYGFEIQASFAGHPQLFPGAAALLEELATLGPIVIVTSSVKEEVEQTLSAHSLNHTVSTILDGRDPRTKAGRITHAMEEFNGVPAQTFMVGDSASDIRHGRSAGVNTIAVTWGYQYEELLVAENPNYIAKNPAEIIQIIKRHLAAEPE